MQSLQKFGIAVQGAAQYLPGAAEYGLGKDARLGWDFPQDAAVGLGSQQLNCQVPDLPLRYHHPKGTLDLQRDFIGDPVGCLFAQGPELGGIDFDQALLAHASDEQRDVERED